MAGSSQDIRIAQCDSLTALGNASTTVDALLRGEHALHAAPVLGRDGGDLVPLALIGHRALDEASPPDWLPAVRHLLAPTSADGWGSARRPVCVASSNYGVGSLYSFIKDRNPAHFDRGSPHRSVDALRHEFGWGDNVIAFSHACVTAHLALLHASRLLTAGLADAVLVFAFDFLSPFVAGGFHALKILNTAFPAPYENRATGAIALGDGAAFAVLTRDQGDFTITGQTLHNEMHHFTANQADGAGFSAALAPLTRAGRRLWIKGHGTGTLDAGRLECETTSRLFPGAPLVGWKGAIGHTLGSCGLVELALVVAALRRGRAPGTIGTTGPTFSDTVARNAFSLDSFDAALCTSNAFGGAHASLLISHA